MVYTSKRQWPAQSAVSNRDMTANSGAYHLSGRTHARGIDERPLGQCPVAPDVEKLMPCTHAEQLYMAPSSQANQQRR